MDELEPHERIGAVARGDFLRNAVKINDFRISSNF